MMERIAHVANGFLGLACAIGEWGLYAERLGDRAVPITGIAVLVASVPYGGAWLIHRVPSLLNVPNQDAYDALSTTDQREVVAGTRPFFFWSATIWMGAAMLFSGATEAAKIGERATLAILVVGPLLAGMLDGVLAIYVLFLRAPRELEDLRRSASDDAG